MPPRRSKRLEDVTKRKKTEENEETSRLRKQKVERGREAEREVEREVEREGESKGLRRSDRIRKRKKIEDDKNGYNEYDVKVLEDIGFSVRENQKNLWAFIPSLLQKESGDNGDTYTFIPEVPESCIESAEYIMSLLKQNKRLLPWQGEQQDYLAPSKAPKIDIYDGEGTVIVSDMGVQEDLDVMLQLVGENAKNITEIPRIGEGIVVVSAPKKKKEEEEVAPFHFGVIVASNENGTCAVVSEVGRPTEKELNERESEREGEEYTYQKPKIGKVKLTNFSIIKTPEEFKRDGDKHVFRIAT